MFGFAHSKVSQRYRLTARVWMMLGMAFCGTATLNAQQPNSRKIAPPDDLMIQYPAPQPRAKLVQASLLIRAGVVRSTYSVDGTGFTVAVLDTGARTTHVDFAGAGKIPAQRNYTADNGGNPNDAADGQGHGTNVGGIICANGTHIGIAPGAKMIPIKVLSNSGSGSFAGIEQGLDWVIANRVTHNITCVCMSLGAGDNATTDASYTNDSIRLKLVTLRNARVAVCIAAGNSFGGFSSQEGMSYPAILRECISVGATYDGDVGSFTYGGGVTAITTGPKRITPFSQRLHPSTNANTRTDTFAPGAPLTSTGYLNDNAESTMHGTSQATPVVAGLVLLAQHYHKNRTGQLPTIDQLESWLRRSSSTIFDGDEDGDGNVDPGDEDDNVVNTNKTYFFADAVEAFLGIVNDLGPPPSPLGGNVVVNYNATTKTLTLTGDVKSNILKIEYKSATDKIEVTGLNGTKVNNKTTVQSFTHLKANKLNFGAVMSDGDDYLTVTGVDASRLYFDLGKGADKVALNLCKAGQLSVDGGNGVDILLTPPGNTLPAVGSANRIIKNVP